MQVWESKKYQQYKGSCSPLVIILSSSTKIRILKETQSCKKRNSFLSGVVSFATFSPFKYLENVYIKIELSQLACKALSKSEVLPALNWSSCVPVQEGVLYIAVYCCRRKSKLALFLNWSLIRSVLLNEIRVPPCRRKFNSVRLFANHSSHLHATEAKSQSVVSAYDCALRCDFIAMSVYDYALLDAIFFFCGWVRNVEDDDGLMINILKTFTIYLYSFTYIRRRSHQQSQRKLQV